MEPLKKQKLTAEWVRDRLVDLISRTIDIDKQADSADHDISNPTFLPDVTKYCRVHQAYTNKLVLRFPFSDPYFPGAEVVVTVGKPDSAMG